MSIGKLLFSFEGRISRITYWAVTITLILLKIAAIGLLFVDEDLFGLVLLLNIPLIWIHLAISAKRWHDLNHSGWMALTLFFPLLNFLIIFYLGIAPGTQGTNSFGRDPRNLDNDAAGRCPQCGVVKPEHANWCPSICLG
jgi:uncharacterized membrane protein YhaH (DUF805 family)